MHANEIDLCFQWQELGVISVISRRQIILHLILTRQWENILHGKYHYCLYLNRFQFPVCPVYCTTVWLNKSTIPRAGILADHGVAAKPTLYDPLQWPIAEGPMGADVLD